MTQQLSRLQTSKQQKDLPAFKQILAELLPELKSYVQGRLRSAERQGSIPENLYSATDIVDEIYLELFEEDSDLALDPILLKTRLFQLADQRLDKLVTQEADWNSRKVPVEEIIQEEIKLLRESFYPEEAFDDIGYHKDEAKAKLYLAEEGFEDQLLDWLALAQAVAQDTRLCRKLARVYDNLPPLSKSILELKLYGGLTVEEIADIRNLAAEDVTAILEEIKDLFRRCLKE